ncbi:MAG: S8 family serine peptidase [Planctomycetota bacterium]|nr:S8 family serine peptidase [Planctomycetota bacterium]
MTVHSTLKMFGAAQVLVTLKHVAPGDKAALNKAKPAMKRVENHFAVRETSQVSMLAAEMSRTCGRRKSASAVRTYPNLGLMFGTVDATGYANLRKDPAVDSVTPAPALSLIRPVATLEVKKSKGLTWGLKRLGVKALWDQGYTGSGVLVGHLDTGVDAKHPALKGAIDAFAEFDMLGNRVPGAKARDSGRHGTHTAGTIVGRAVGTTAIGVAPGAKLASALVIEGGDVVARILGGMDWIVGTGAKILSMSLGLRGYRDEFLPLMQALRARGVLPVIAVGNEGPGTSRSPGNYALVLSVGASDAADDVAGFSSSQRLNRPDDPLVPDLVAPGDGVLSALPNGRYGRLSGTSMATPHIAGLAALLWDAVPAATMEQIEAAIFDSCKRPPSMPSERANRGVPDAKRALDALRIAVSGSSSLEALPPPQVIKRRRAARKAPKKRSKAARKTPKSERAAASKAPRKPRPRKKK